MVIHNYEHLLFEIRDTIRRYNHTCNYANTAPDYLQDIDYIKEDDTDRFTSVIFSSIGMFNSYKPVYIGRMFNPLSSDGYSECLATITKMSVTE